MAAQSSAARTRSVDGGAIRAPRSPEQRSPSDTRTRSRTGSADEQKRLVYRGPYVQNQKATYQTARDAAASNRHAQRTAADVRHQTTDNRVREARSQYNSVVRTRTSRLAQKQTAAARSPTIAYANEHVTQPRSYRTAANINRTPKKQTRNGWMKKARIAITTAIPGLGFHWVILFFWVVSAVGVALALMGEQAAEWLQIFGDLTSIATYPGFVLFGFGWFVATAIGLLTMIATVLWLMFRRMLPLRDGWVVLALIVSTTLYIVPIINFFPWFLLLVVTALWRS